MPNSFVKSFHNKIKKWIVYFESYIEKAWYEWVFMIVVGVDIFLILVPIDGILVSSVLICKRKWWRLALFTTIGYVAGSIAFILFVKYYGWAFINYFFPDITTSSAWQTMDTLFQQHGLWVLFVVSLAPMMQHPVLVLAAFSSHSLSSLFWVILAGRLIKYFFMASISRFAPQYLSRLWGVQGELKEAGVPKL